MHKIPRLDRGARRRLIRRAKKATDPHTALGLIRFGGQFDYATNLNRAALSCSAGLA